MKTAPDTSPTHTIPSNRNERMMTTYYMHTIDGKPAAFIEDQIYFMPYYGSAKCRTLARSLRQIRREQKKAAEFRAALGYHNDFEYGYVRVATP